MYILPSTTTYIQKHFTYTHRNMSNDIGKRSREKIRPIF